MSLIATRLQNWRVANPALDKNMTRPQEYGALNFFIDQTDAANSIISPELRERAFASMGNTVQIPVIDFDGDVQVSTVRSCVIGDDENTSKLYTVNWMTLAVGFTMVPSLYRNKEISYENDFARKMEKICRALANEMDVQAVFLPGTAGNFEVLPSHAPIISTLEEGDIRWRTPDGCEESLKVKGGVMRYRTSEFNASNLIGTGIAEAHSATRNSVGFDASNYREYRVMCPVSLKW